MPRVFEAGTVVMAHNGRSVSDSSSSFRKWCRHRPVPRHVNGFTLCVASRCVGVA